MHSPLNSRGHRALRPTGFTLVEVLVVIGIIALLISILLPALNKARGAANEVKCLANLRTLGQAVVMYSVANKGVVLPTVIWKNGGVDYWPSLLIANKLLPPQDASADTTNPNALSSVLICPSVLDVVQENSPGDGAKKDDPTFLLDGRWTFNTYGINGTSFTVGGNGGEPATSQQVNAFPSSSISFGTDAVYPLKKTSRIKRSAEVALIFDGKEWNIWASPAAANIIVSRLSGQRHGKWDPTKPDKSGRTNVLFLDGHAAGFARQDLPGITEAAFFTDFSATGAAVVHAKDKNAVFRLDSFGGTQAPR